MNIFVLDYNIQKCPTFYVDSHINAQIKEGAQMLSVAFWANDEEHAKSLNEKGIIYKKSHYNHPCTKWVRKSLENWLYLRELIIYTHEERLYRFPNREPHKSFLLSKSMPVPDFLPNIARTPFALAMPDECKSDDPVQSYRDYYNKHKRHLFVWKNRETPYWIKI
jgi:hypothetical protein